MAELWVAWQRQGAEMQSEGNAKNGEGDAQQSNGMARLSVATAEQPKNNLKRRNNNE